MKEFYNDLIENLKFLILQKYGTIRAFCKEKHISETSLSKVFNRERKISVKLFLVVVRSLDLSGGDKLGIVENVSLPEYLEIDYTEVTKAVLRVMTR